jgi:hypothetical protein
VLPFANGYDVVLDLQWNQVPVLEQGTEQETEQVLEQGTEQVLVLGLGQEVWAHPRRRAQQQRGWREAPGRAVPSGTQI